MNPAVLAPYRRPAAAPWHSWWDDFDLNRGMAMPPQAQDWTCSICATDWVLLATWLDPTSTREQTAGEIGYPSCVNPQVGLADTQCLVRVLSSYGPQAHQEWVDWNRAVELCSSTTGVLNSTSWYHFVAIRGMTADGQLWIANSAPGYQGIYDTISPEQFSRWAGSWQIVWLER
jgi:hypothetical protein